jgi:ankyrin repeat protein
MFMFADYLELNDINNFVRTSREINRRLTPFMYRRAKARQSIRGRPYFLLAVDSGNITAVRRFIEVGTSVNMIDTTNLFFTTALHTCVYRQNIKIAQLLIGNGVNMARVNGLRWTPLHCAVSAKCSNEALVSVLLDAGADMSTTCWCCETILFTAAKYAPASIMQLLLHRGAVPSIRKTDGATLLHCAMKDATVAAVRHLLDAGVNIEATNNLGQTALHMAAQLGRRVIVRVLLDWGASVHAIDNDGFTPLQTLLKSSATMYAAHSILHHYTQANSGLCKTCEAGARMRPLAQCDGPVVDQLLSAGANIRASSNYTRSALDWATNMLEDR